MKKKHNKSRTEYKMLLRKRGERLDTHDLKSISTA